MSYILRHHLNTLIQAFLACQESQPALTKISLSKIVSGFHRFDFARKNSNDRRAQPRVLVTAMVGQDERKFLTPRKALE
jgi:hypothetical protein